MVSLQVFRRVSWRKETCETLQEVLDLDVVAVATLPDLENSDIPVWQ